MNRSCQPYQHKYEFNQGDIICSICKTKGLLKEFWSLTSAEAEKRYNNFVYYI